MREQRYPVFLITQASATSNETLRFSRYLYIFASRVRLTAVDVLDSTNETGVQLVISYRRKLYTSRAIAIDNERIIDPVADIYLEQAISDYPAHGTNITDDWLPLQSSLIRHTDTIGLLGLDNCRY